MIQPRRSEVVKSVASLAEAYLTTHTLRHDDVGPLLRQLGETLNGLSADIVASTPEPAPAKRATALQIRKSITADYLISFEDGRPYRALKRHLTVRGLTPAAYREKWGLSEDYPMVAPAYAAERSEIAKAAGLGKRTRGRSRAKPGG